MKFQGMNQMKATLAAIVMGVVLAACSAGGSKSTDTTTPTTPTTPTNPVAADLLVTVTTPTAGGLQDTGAQTATVTVTAVDAKRNVVSGAPVSIVPDDTAVVTVSSAVTDAVGVVTGQVGIGSDKSNRSIAVVVTSGSISKTVNINVVGAALTATLNPSVVLPSTAASVLYHLSDAVGNPIPGVTIAVSGSLTANGPTDANGNFVYNYTSPSTEQVLSFSAVGANATASSTVTVSSGVIPPAATKVQSAALTADPSTVSINIAPSTTNQVNLRATFLGANNQPIPNIRVRFDTDGDASGTGGTLSSQDNVVYSDANGIARTTYTPGAIQSGNQKMVLRACWSNNDFPLVTPAGAACPSGNELVSPITVAGASVSVAIDTDNLIAVLASSPLIYQLGYAVQVIDSVGNPVPGVQVSGAVDLPRYYKGQFTVVGSSWALVSPGAQSCNNEDLNRSGNKDVYPSIDGITQAEDANASGGLEPFAAAVTITAQTPTSGSTHGSDYTDKFGRAYFFLQYGANYATWEDFVLTFSAIVAGSEGHRSTLPIALPAPASVFKDVAANLPFADSPYGTDANSGFKLVTPTTGTPTSLCTESPSNVTAP